MADIKVLYVNSTEDYQEHSESADSIKMLSLKTANNELTDTKLGKLIDGTDAADEHIHDARYYTETEIGATSGTSGADLVGIKDTADIISATTVEGALAENRQAVDTIEGVGITGGDGISTSGTIGGGNLSVAFDVSDTAITKDEDDMSSDSDSHLATQQSIKAYVDNSIASTGSSAEWQDSVLNVQVDATLDPGASPTVGDRYIIEDAAALHANFGTINQDLNGNAVVLADDDIVEYVSDDSGEFRVACSPTTGTYTSADDETSSLRYFSGSAWVQKYYEATTASTGLTMSGVDVQLADASASNGVSVSSGAISAVVDGTSIEINGSEQIGVLADGIDDTHIDWGTGANQVSAVDVPIADAGGYFTTDDVESALQQLASTQLTPGVTYTTGTGGIDKGDVVYISGTETVLPWSTLTSAHKTIGLAATTQAATEDIVVLANDIQLTGLTIAGSPSAGDPIYWDGSGLTATAPTTSGAYVIQAGIYTGTSGVIHVECRIVKKNA